MALLITPEANDDVAELYSFGTLMFGFAAATDYTLGLEAAFHLLGEFPRSGRERQEVRPPVRVWLYRSHIVAYRVENEDVVILRVLHHSMDWMDEL